MRLLNAVFGAFHWEPPPWLQRFGTGRFLGFAGGTTLLALIVALGYFYYDSLPKPPSVVATVGVPGITPVVDGKLAPESLTLNFSDAVNSHATAVADQQLKK